jgi:D-serine deaminase-like pyridoxal phosphate-dependent protein
MLRYMDGDPDRWRVHLKTTKIPEIYRMLVDAGVRAFKCATVREAQCVLEVLEQAEVSEADLLIAYPMQGPALKRAAALAQRFSATRVSILSEDPRHVAQADARLGIFVDVNPGMHRTGIGVADARRIEAVAQAAGERFGGVHFYDGHIHDADAKARRAAAHAVYREVVARIDALRAAGIAVPELITSGTPSFRYALDFPGFSGGRLDDSETRHRVSPGTVVFHDYQYDELLEDLDLEPAALVLARVVSHPREGVVTCDAGSKSIASEAGNPVGYAVGHPELVGLPPSEEHLPMRNDGAGTLPLGEVLHLVPRHVCPTVNLAEQALLVRSGGDTEVVEVRGRAHELLLAD